MFYIALRLIIFKNKYNPSFISCLPDIEVHIFPHNTSSGDVAQW